MAKAHAENHFEPAMFQNAPVMFQDALELGRKRMEAIAEIQKEVFHLCEQTSCHWMDRLKQEADFTAQLSKDLSACKSIPEMVATYQNWLGQHMKLIASDSESLIADSQKIIAASTRMMSDDGDGTAKRS